MFAEVCRENSLGLTWLERNQCKLSLYYRSDPVQIIIAVLIFRCVCMYSCVVFCVCMCVFSCHFHLPRTTNTHTCTQKLADSHCLC